MSENQFQDINSSFSRSDSGGGGLPPDSGTNQSSSTKAPSPETTQDSVSASETDLNVSDHIIKERPFISTRLSMPHDPVQPRGVNTISRIPPGYSRNRGRSAFGSGLGMDDELGITESQDTNPRNVSGSVGTEGISETGSAPDAPPTGRSFRDGDAHSNDRSAYGRTGRPPRRPYGSSSYNPAGPDNFPEAPGNYGSRNRSGGNYSGGNYGSRNYGGGNYNSGNYGGENRGNYGGGSYAPGNRGNGSHTGGWHGSESWKGPEAGGERPPYGNNNGNAGGNGNYAGRRKRRSAENYSAFNPAFPELGSGKRPHKEPLSLAEELAEEMNRNHRAPVEGDDVKNDEILLRDESVGRLQKLSMQELIAEARRFEIGVEDEENAKKHDIIFRILKEKIKLNGLLYGEGTLEILPDGFGFLRSTEFHYLSCPDDIYVSPSQIRRFGLKTGTIVSGQIRPPKENERYFALLRVEAINYHDPNEFSRKKNFDDLIPTHPTQRLRLEVDPDEIETRVLDMMIPIGFGQRGLIISPPRAGKTMLLQKIARAALKNYPDLYVFILLVDERPEEVTDMRKQVKGLNCEVVCSTFDEPTLRHIQVADMVLEKAKRMVEYGQNVVILLDSITRLVRAWNNADSQPGGKPMNAPLDTNAFQNPKRFFSSARSIEGGGSLTILAAALTDTGSPIDDAILEEFKGTGNLEIVLDKRLLEQRVWPAIDLNQSGTRREEALLPDMEFQATTKLRRVLFDLNPVNAMELLTNRLRKTRTNAEFLESLADGSESPEKETPDADAQSQVLEQ